MARVHAAVGVAAWRQVPRVVRATEAILRVNERASRNGSAAAIEIGRRMAMIQGELARGQFLAWVKEAVPFGVRTVQRHLVLAAWAEREPEVIDRYAHLGPSKLYRIAALPLGIRGKLVPRTLVPIPGGDEKKTIETMTVGELDRVIGGLVTPPVRRVPVAKIVAGYRFRIAGLSVLTEQLVARAREVDATLASELAAELHGLAQTLQAAFDG